MSTAEELARRDVLKSAGLFAAGVGLWPGALLGRRATGSTSTPRANAASIGRREIVAGLDGMSRVANPGYDPFTDGHGAAAVIASAFFCRENELDEPTQETILSLIGSRFLTSPIYAPRAEEPADPELVSGLVTDLDDGIDTLRASGHSIIFAAISLRALREVPEAATSARIKGLRRMVRSFGTGAGSKAPARVRSSIPDIGDEKAFIRFVFEEYLRALDLYLDGNGHHGFAGHVLTIGHALIELCRMNHPETARKGLDAYAQFIEEARAGADLGGARVRDHAHRCPTALERKYWIAQVEHPVDGLVSSHRIKYPYSFYALLKDLPDGALRQGIMQKIAHLTAVS